LCWLVLTGPRTSRQHARVRVRRGQLFIEDLGSRNGTRVNGSIVSGLQPLVHGDVIEVGTESLQVIVSAALHPEVVEHETLSEPVALEVDDTLEEPLATAQRHVLELAEELLLRGSRGAERDAVGQTICAMVDSLVVDIERTGNRLTPGEAVRLLSVSQIAAQWTRAPELRDWSSRLAQTLAPGEPMQ